MRDLVKLEKEYKEFIDRLSDINKRIEAAADEEIEREFDFMQDDACHYKYLYQNEIMDISDEDYNVIVEQSVKIRHTLFEEKYNIMREFDVWRYKNDIKYHDFKETQLNYREYTPKWRGWDSSPYVYRTMIYSINSTVQDEVNKIIDDMEKIIKLTRESFINQDNVNYFIDENINYLKIINNETRFGEDDCCMSTLALDLMENDGMYNSYMESFKEFICRVCDEVDNDFMYMLRVNEREGHKLEEK